MKEMFIVFFLLLFIKTMNCPVSFFSLLADILHLNNWKDDLRQGILVDLYFYTLQYPFITDKSYNNSTT